MSEGKESTNRMRVAIVVTTFANPERLDGLLNNMIWSGMPDIPVRVYEDVSPYDNATAISAMYADVAQRHEVPIKNFGTWQCMQGVFRSALYEAEEDWVIWVPDDVSFLRGGLWQEYANVLAYGREFVAAIQAPYWNANDLHSMGLIPSRGAIYDPDVLGNGIPRNPHWDWFGIPRTYINVNGAGFAVRPSFVRKVEIPLCTWRFDEWIGYCAWMSGKVCITSPGPPRLHYGAGGSSCMPPGLDYHTEAAWERATGGITVQECSTMMYSIKNKLPGEDWNQVLDFFSKGGRLC